MKKEEVIQKAYGKHWKDVKDYVNENGFCSERKDIGFHEIITTMDIDMPGYHWRPTSLRGIETNNGWVKIESEDDLPKTDGKNIEYFFMTNHGNVTTNGYCDSKSKAKQYASVYTHYQPIIKPQSPIY